MLRRLTTALRAHSIRRGEAVQAAPHADHVIRSVIGAMSSRIPVHAAEDVEFVAPQVIHYGLDTLAIDILGTSAWTDPRVLETVSVRHTTGVVATAPVGREAGSEGQLRFQEAYEEYFQRSLISSTPAVAPFRTATPLSARRKPTHSRPRTPPTDKPWRSL